MNAEELSHKVEITEVSGGGEDVEKRAKECIRNRLDILILLDKFCADKRIL